MKTSSKRLISLLLTLCLAVGCIAPTFAAGNDYQVEYTHDWDHECQTECHGECGTNPIIIVPGIMQSQVYVQAEEGGDLLTSDGFPIVEGMDMSFMFDTVALKQAFKEAIGDILLSILTLNRDKLLDIVVGILDESFQSHYFNPDGTRRNDVSVDEYWYSLAKCKETPEKSYNYAKGYSTDDNGNALPTTKYKTEFDFINRQVDITSYCEKYGYDHTYYYSYASFGNILDTAKGLAEYVEMVKAQTGHDKVSIVFISLGGTIGNVFLTDYCDPDSIDRIVYAACAADGSYLLGDLMGGKSTLKDGNVLYNDLIPNIVALAAEEYMSLAYLGNTIARAIPQALFSDFLEEALQRGIDECIGKLIRNCQSMWALVPSAQYPELSAKYISDADHAELKALTDRYYEIQKNAPATIKKLSDEGMDIFVVCGYDLELPAAVEHYKLSADNIIQSSSTSLGATFADCGSVLPDDYKPAIDASYISPDGIVDAGTCALPDRTWFVKGQSHLKLQSAVNDVIEMCVQIVTDHSITDSRVNNGGYPQFTEYRDLSEIESLLRTYLNAKQNGALDALSESDRAAVDAAYEEAVALLANRNWKTAEAKEFEEKFTKVMNKAGLLSKKDTSPAVKYGLLPFLEKILKFVSNVFTVVFGGRDFYTQFLRIFDIFKK